MELEGNNGVYTISHVVCDQQVAVTLVDAPTQPENPEGPAEEEHTVTVPTGNGFRVNYSGGDLADGDSFSFTVTVTDPSKVAIVKVNGVELNAVNGVYTVSNVLSDQQIAVILVDAPVTPEPPEEPTTPTEPTPPAETFDASAIHLVTMLCILSVAALYVMISRKKKV